MNGPKTAIATWKPQYLLRVTTLPEGLTPAPTRDPAGENNTDGWWYEVSASVTLTAQPVPHYTFDRWYVDGNPQTEAVDLIIVAMNSPHNATASYMAPDIAVTGVASAKTVIGQGYTATVKVNVTNLWSSAEIFNLTLYANTTEIQTQTVILAPGDFLTVPFTWNTTGFAKGNYTLSAYAWPVLGEANVTNNHHTGNGVTVSIPGDVDGNLKVDMGDIVALTKAFGSQTGQPKYLPNLDIDDNGKIDMGDIITAAKNFGQHYP
jgi:hypothetical protein